MIRNGWLTPPHTILEIPILGRKPHLALPSPVGRHAHAVAATRHTDLEPGLLVDVREPQLLQAAEDGQRARDDFPFASLHRLQPFLLHAYLHHQRRQDEVLLRRGACPDEAAVQRQTLEVGHGDHVVRVRVAGDERADVGQIDLVRLGVLRVWVREEVRRGGFVPRVSPAVDEGGRGFVWDENAGDATEFLRQSVQRTGLKN